MFADKALFLISLSPKNYIVVCLWILWHLLGKALLLGKIIIFQPHLSLSGQCWCPILVFLEPSFIYIHGFLIIFSVKVTLCVQRLPMPASWKLPQCLLTRLHFQSHTSAFLIPCVVPVFLLLFCFYQRWQNKLEWILNTWNPGKKEKEKVCRNKCKILL